MKTTKSIKLAVSLTLVAILVCSSLGSFANTTSNERNENRNNNVLSVKKTTETTSVTFNHEKLKSTSIASSEDDISDIVISNESDAEMHPAIAAGGKNVLVAYESEDSQRYVRLKSSKDYGNTWSDYLPLNLGGIYDSYDLNSPNLDIKPGSNLVYGTVVSSYKNSGVYSFFKVSDISSSITSVSKTSIDWTNVSYNATTGEYFSFFDFSTPNIINYDNDTTPWVIALIGSTNYSDDGVGPCTNSPMFSYNDLSNPDDYVSIAWFPNIEDCSNLAIANEYGDDMIYGVCEINNGSNQDLLFFRGNPLLWNPDDAELTNKTITSNDNLLHPKIAVNGNHIYIIAESDAEGIVIYRSTNQGDSWSKIKVTENILEPTDNPTYPDIVFDGTDWICSFILNRNLSLTTSNNSGVNWSDPVMINDVNDSVVASYRCYDIANKDQIVWTDNREGNNDVYYQLSYIPSIDLEVVSFGLVKENILFPMKNLISIVVKNNGDGYAENVLVNISYECDDGNVTTLPYTATIPRIEASQTKTVSTTLFVLQFSDIFQAYIDFAGITNITVTVDPYEEKGDTDYSNNVLPDEFEYKDIFNILWRFEDFFKLLK